MRHRSVTRGGYTLVEITIAAALLVLGVSLAFRGLTYVLRETNLSQAQSELDINVQTAMERVKRDLRLTSLELMYFYPEGSGPYTAMSFPMARDDDGDGAVDLDPVTGLIEWDQTYVYHVWTSEPHQLRLTRFDPRNNDLTETQRQQQLDDVVEDGHGNSTFNGSNAVTSVVFENLFEWTITPRGSRFDGYASSLGRERNVILGSCVLTNGTHTFKFSVIDKNPSSSGRKMGVDSFVVSPCGVAREAEAQLPVDAESGATAVARYMAGGSWDGNFDLYFPSSANDHYFTLSMENDRWEETNFKGTGASRENTVVEFDETLTPDDFAVQLEGLGTNWSARAQIK